MMWKIILVVLLLAFMLLMWVLCAVAGAADMAMEKEMAKLNQRKDKEEE